MKNILIAGGAGFIGSNFIRFILNKYPNYKVINLDLLTYAAKNNTLSDVENNNNYTFINGNISNRELIKYIVMQYKIDAVINFAAESHVDRSIIDSSDFVRTNILGTSVLLDVVKDLDLFKFVQVSTDEVYGSLGSTNFFTEKSALSSNNPYSASKASADLLVLSYFKTYNLNVNVTRCSNNYGTYQHPEKLIPMIITRSIETKTIPIYGNGKNIRDWIHVFDHCAALDLVLHEGVNGEIYNIGSNNEYTNNEIVDIIFKKMNIPISMKTFVEDRLGHDKRYAIDSSKIKEELGWQPKFTFDIGIDQTINWYKHNQSWWRN